MATSNNSSNAKSNMPPRFQPRLPLFRSAPAFSLLAAPGTSHPTSDPCCNWLEFLDRGSFLKCFA